MQKGTTPNRQYVASPLRRPLFCAGVFYVHERKVNEDGPRHCFVFSKECIGFGTLVIDVVAAYVLLSTTNVRLLCATCLGRAVFIAFHCLRACSAATPSADSDEGKDKRKRIAKAPSSSTTSAKQKSERLAHNPPSSPSSPEFENSSSESSAEPLTPSTLLFI